LLVRQSPVRALAPRKLRGTQIEARLFLTVRCGNRDRPRLHGASYPGCGGRFATRYRPSSQTSFRPRERGAVVIAAIQRKWNRQLRSGHSASRARRV